ncbi:MAG: phytanoyl-CoA dioxygenase family protein [Vulcanimicrobiota bacterium]
MPNTISRALERDGFAWWRGFLSESDIIETIGRLPGELPEKAGGLRLAGLDGLETVVARCQTRLSQELSDTFRVVRAILFVKNQLTSWSVPWHRDLMIPVREHLPSAVFLAPSVKDGVPHVKAPPQILADMVTTRIHLDLADSDNGALEVVAGSHRDLESRQERPSTLCRAEAGDALLLRPLLLHASAKPNSSRARRVLHLEWATNKPLPDGFHWHEP